MEALKRPAVRIPLLMIVIVGCSLWAFRSCPEYIEEKAKTLQLVNARRVSFIKLLAAAATEAEKRPEGLGELVRPAKAGELSPVQKMFLRGFAERPEFRKLADPEAEPLRRLGNIEVWSAPGHESHEREILWSCDLQPPVLLRLCPSPKNEEDFVIFSWPQNAGKAQLTLAYLSTEPERIYYTSAPHYVGPGQGPTTADLGEAPFAGKINLLPPDAVGDSYDEFLRRAEAEEGKLWAWRKVEEVINVPD